MPGPPSSRHTHYVRNVPIGARACVVFPLLLCNLSTGEQDIGRALLKGAYYNLLSRGDRSNPFLASAMRHEPSFTRLVSVSRNRTRRHARRSSAVTGPFGGLTKMGIFADPSRAVR